MLFYVVWALEGCVRSRSHCSVFVMMHFCCIKATPFTLLRFLCKNEEKNIPFCASTLLRFCEAHYWTLGRFQKPPFLCVHIDQMRFQNPPFLWISTFDSVFKTLRFGGVFVQNSVNTFTKMEIFLSYFVQKQSSVNGA